MYSSYYDKTATPADGTVTTGTNGTTCGSKASEEKRSRTPLQYGLSRFKPEPVTQTAA
jgi:hypothetical protein